MTALGLLGDAFLRLCVHLTLQHCRRPICEGVQPGLEPLPERHPQYGSGEGSCRRVCPQAWLADHGRVKQHHLLSPLASIIPCLLLTLKCFYASPNAEVDGDFSVTVLVQVTYRDWPSFMARKP